MSSVAVIGGGITGLTAAFRLQEQGHKVSLFEAGSLLFIQGQEGPIHADPVVMQGGLSTIYMINNHVPD